MIHQRTVKNEIDLAEKKILLGQTNSAANLALVKVNSLMHLARALAPLKLFTNCQYRSHIDHIRQREYVLQCFVPN
jgi:hypothetical protein